MADLFANLRSGVQFPQVVMNQGPLPGSGGLPRPLHDTPDARINYNSSLLGNITPYAYGEPGYLSSQTAYLNIPHKIQKHVPIVYLPEPRAGSTDFFDLAHAVDDGDLVFTLRLARNSLFCTGSRHNETRRSGLSTRIDPLINLPTVNYLLSGIQLGISKDNAPGDLWSELLFNLDPRRFGKSVGVDGRDYATQPLALSDIVHIVQHCVRPFGVARGSEKQGGQNEVGMGPSTWPVGAMLSITLDGKESNVLNLWHHVDMSAGDDLALGLKLMPLRPYTLNHYFEGFKRKTWADDDGRELYVWQLVPTLVNLDHPTAPEMDLMKKRLANVASPNFTRLMPFPGRSVAVRRPATMKVNETTPWQELGYWHIGRTQIMTGKYGVEEYWHNDQANSMRTNHLDITLQPFFARPPPQRGPNKANPILRAQVLADKAQVEKPWAPSLFLEKLEDRRVRQRVVLPGPPPRRAARVVEPVRQARPSLPPVPPLPPVEQPPLDAESGGVGGDPVLGLDAGQASESGWVGGMLGLGAGQAAALLEEDIGVLEEAGPVPAAPAAKKQAKKKGSGRTSVVDGSLLCADGTLESVSVSML
jgi:hypothetical protein